MCEGAVPIRRMCPEGPGGLKMGSHMESHNGIATTATRRGITIFVPLEHVQISLECHEDNQENDVRIARGRRTRFAEMVAVCLHNEIEEDGTTPIHRAIDTAISCIIDNGDDGDGVLIYSD